jgi:geranylgeranyl diphosphate synthase type I
MNIEAITNQINLVLREQVQELTNQINEIDDQLNVVSTTLSDYLAEGKRFRALFATLGYLGANGKLSPEIFKAVSSLELLQASALIHDDLMDESDTRRGKASVHKQFALRHGEKFGASAALLIGNLALIWSEQVLQQSAFDKSRLMEVNEVFSAMRNELMAGQFLDIFEQTQPEFSIERSLKIARYKSGKYSVERPLHFGAALSSPSDLQYYYTVYSEFGLPLGEAFQLRDDLLGIFGDPKVTGKPAGDDLREGKKTALIAYAFERGSDAVRDLIQTKLGTPLNHLEIEQLINAIDETGAVTHIENLIEKLSEIALDSLSQSKVAPEARKMLEQMVDMVTNRKR